MNLRESRVLSTVQRLGCPTTLDVAEALGYTTADARALLNGLEQKKEIYSFGRRWSVPSAALAQDPRIAPDLPPVVDLPGPGCGVVGILILVLTVIGLVSVVCKLKECL